MIRVFIYPEWWMTNNVVPATASGQGYSTTAVSTQTYLQTLASEAEQYGIYIDIVPYQLTCYKGSFSSDPYISIKHGGITGTTHDQTTGTRAASSYIASTGLTEQAFWTTYWTSMANGLKAYPNVIFEAWNEPSGSSANTIPSGYLSYLTTMYNAIRAAGSTNLIMMQWQPGWEPNAGLNLSWASQINTALGGNPTNMVYTTHLYYYSPSDDSPFWNQAVQVKRNPMTVSQLETQLQGLANRHGNQCPAGDQRRRLMPLIIKQRTKRLHMVRQPASSSKRTGNRRRSLLLAKQQRTRRNIRRRISAVKRLRGSQHGTRLH